MTQATDEGLFVPGDLVMHSLAFYGWLTFQRRDSHGPGLVIWVGSDDRHCRVLWSMTLKIEFVRFERLERFKQG